MDLRDVLHVERAHRRRVEQAEQHVVEIARALARIHDQRLLIEIGERQRGLGKPRIAHRQRSEQGFGLDAPRLEFLPVERRADEADVDQPGQQPLDLLGGHHLAKLDLDIGQRRPHRSDDLRQVAVSEAAVKPIATRPASPSAIRRVASVALSASG